MLMPFSLTSILFIQSLSPMVIGYREKFPEDKEFAKQKAVKGMKVAFLLLAIIIFSFICSFALAIPHDLAIFATEHNQSAFIALEHANKSRNYNKYLCNYDFIFKHISWNEKFTKRIFKSDNKALFSSK